MIGYSFSFGYDAFMMTAASVRDHRDAILEIARRYGAHDIRIFGSVARGDATESSDLDLIVRFEPGRSLFDHGGFLMDLRDLLGVKVDVISEGGLRDRFREHVMKEAIPL
jgi:predicted nucleotidyltransferase